MPAKKKQSKTARVLNWLKPTSLGKGMLLFAIAFALIGGSYEAYRSFAATSPWTNLLNFFQCQNINGIPATIGQGSSGNCVKLAQYTLIHYANQNISLDGSYGQATTGAVRNLQTISHLSVTGVVDTPTWFTMAVLVNNHTGFSPQTQTYFCNSPGIHLNGGSCNDIQSATLMVGNMWYGPYRNMSVPYGAHGIIGCFLVASNGSNVSFHYDMADNYGHVLKSGDNSTGNSYESGFTECLAVAGSGNFPAVEARIYPTTNNGPLYIFDTTLAYY